MLGGNESDLLKAEFITAALVMLWSYRALYSAYYRSESVRPLTVILQAAVTTQYSIYCVFAWADPNVGPRLLHYVLLATAIFISTTVVVRLVYRRIYSTFPDRFSPKDLHTSLVPISASVLSLFLFTITAYALSASQARLVILAVVTAMWLLVTCFQHPTYARSE